MAQYLLPRSSLPQIPEILSAAGAVHVCAMDDQPICTPAHRWHRFTCRDGNAAVAASVDEPEARPNLIVVSVSTDLRRLPRLWRILGDVRLVRRLNRILEDAGGQLLVEDD